MFVIYKGRYYLYYVSIFVSNRFRGDWEKNAKMFIDKYILN